MKELLEIATNAALQAKAIASSFVSDPMVLSSKFKDIKTFADIRMNEVITTLLGQTGIPILSEEETFALSEIPDLCWVVDPLDGTLNFSRKYPCVGISIALLDNGIPVLGVVIDIFNNTSYSSITGSGALKNGLVMSVSDTKQMQDAVLATGFPSGTRYDKEHLLHFISSVQQFKKIRAIGAASIMLSYVASGIFDAYYEKDIYLWDVAAGLSLVSEAGGKYIMRKTQGIFRYEVLATNAAIFDATQRHFLINSIS